MIIIIEGLDRCGKTTQSNLLIKRMKDYGFFHKLHYSNLPFTDKETHIKYSKNLYEDMFGLMNSLKDSHNLIFDRSHLGESVYSPIYRGYDGDFVFDIENNNIDNLKDYLFLIVLIAEPDLIQKRNDGQSLHTNQDDIKKEVNGFINAFEKTRINNKILIHVDGKTPNEISDIIFNFLFNL